MIARQPYYTVGEKIVLRADEVFKEHRRSGLPFEFHPGLDFLKSPQWRIEPPETIPELRLQRALQIREKYENVILFVSGGTDSTPILRTFVENNIELDQIRIAVNDTWAVMRNREHNEIIVPLLKKYLQDHNYEAEVRVDVIPAFLEEHARGWETWKDGSIPILTPTGFQAVMGSDSLHLSQESSNTGLIFGREKPTVVVHNNEWCWVGLDKMLFCQETNLNNEFLPAEEFYLTDDFPQLQIKMAWVLARFLETTWPELKDRATLLQVQGRSGSSYSKCCEAMDLIPMHTWLATPDTQSSNPEHWHSDIRRAFHDREDLLKDFSAHNKALREDIPEEFIHSDPFYEGLLEDTQTLAGIWGKPIPFAPCGTLKETMK